MNICIHVARQEGGKAARSRGQEVRCHTERADIRFAGSRTKEAKIEVEKLHRPSEGTSDWARRLPPGSTRRLTCNSSVHVKCITRACVRLFVVCLQSLSLSLPLSLSLSLCSIHA